jgi:hypothetical protein
MKSLGLVLLSACLSSSQPITKMDEDMTSPVDRDLRVAGAALQTDLRGTDLQVLWIGARAPGRYDVERSPMGEPVAQTVQVMIAFKQGTKCFLEQDFSTTESGPLVVREHTGGGRYSAPHVTASATVVTDEQRGDDMACDIAATIKGGAHAPFSTSARTARD